MLCGLIKKALYPAPPPDAEIQCSASVRWPRCFRPGHLLNPGNMKLSIEGRRATEVSDASTLTIHARVFNFIEVANSFFRFIVRSSNRSALTWPEFREEFEKPILLIL